MYGLDGDDVGVLLSNEFDAISGGSGLFMLQRESILVCVPL